MNTANTKKKSVKDIIKKYGGDKTAMIAILQDVQEENRYLPKEALSSISKQMDVPLTRIYEIATFYNAFSLTQRGKNLIEVCAGTACHVQGADSLDTVVEQRIGVAPGNTTADGEFTVERVACLGCCSLAPVVMIDGEVYGRLTGDKLGKIVSAVGGKK